MVLVNGLKTKVKSIMLKCTNEIKNVLVNCCNFFISEFNCYK